MKCVDCGKAIPKERLKIVPETRQCVGCAGTKPRIDYYKDPEDWCAKSSDTARNGFAKND